MGKKTDDLESVNHSKCMLAAFQNFRQDETMLDVTLVCNGMSLKAHKLVLSACSPLFKEILSDNPCAHPVIILRAFEFADLKAIIEFIYKGKLSVPRERLLLALKVAEELQIRGLHRSEPSTEKYEKLYKQMRGKSSSHKKRKRLRRNSSDSDENECLSIPDSDRRVSESDEASSANGETRTESLEAMDVDSARLRESAEVDRLVRPVVLRVGDPVANHEESIRRNLNEDEGSTVEMKTVSDRDSQNECSASLIDNVNDQAYESSSENVATTSKFNAFAAGSDVLPDCIDVDEQFNVQEHSSDSLPVTEYADEQDGLISSSCLSPKSTETHQSEEVRFKDEGKKFICSKCDRVFTSRINFMQHKAMGHNNSEIKKAYECKLCDFTSEEIGCYKEHLQLHSDKVPYKCSSCPEEFTSEDLYKEHLSLHKEEILFSSVQDFFPTEKVSEFRCSICFQRFKSKLSCQLHEKTCQGGN